MSAFPNAASWREACAGDATLAAWAGPWSICFAVASGGDVTVFSLAEGRMQTDAGTPAFTLAAPTEVWAKFLQPVPPRHHHGLFAMHYRVPELRFRAIRWPSCSTPTSPGGYWKSASGWPWAIRRRCR